MKKLLLLWLAVVTFSCSSDDDSGGNAVYTGNIDVYNQQSLDELATKKYSRIEGNLTIHGHLYNLDGLETITEVTGDLVINQSGLLENIDGLKNLESAGSLTISGTVLSNLNALNALTTVKKLEISNNPSLVTISGLMNLKKVTELAIDDNTLLASLHGLEGITSAETIGITYGRFPDFTGLNNLTALQTLTINGDFTSFAGLNNLTALHTLVINGGNLPFHGLNCQQTLRYLHIQNTNLPDLDGLQDLHELKDLNIVSNAKLTSLHGLENLNKLNYLNLTGNTKLVSISALSSLTALGEDLAAGGLSISQCFILPTLDGLQNVSQFKGNVNVNGYEALKDFCALQNILAHGNLNIVAINRSNGLDVPTPEEIVAGNCTVE